MRLTLVISSLTAGGAERIMTYLANRWAQDGHEVLIITIAGEERDFYRLDARVQRIGLRQMLESPTIVQSVSNNARLLARLRRLIRASAPDVVVGFMDTVNVLVLLATSGLSMPVVVSERTDPRHAPIRRIWSILRRVLYRQAAAVVVQTDSVAEWAREATHPRRLVVIPNPVVEPASGFPLREPGTDHHRIASIGRLGPEKGFDLLIRAFGRVAEDYPSWQVVLIGEGRERESLEGLIRELGLEGRVHLLGKLADPTTVLRETSLYVLSSRFEGFPNALLEAMACGLPVIATDCPSGPAEIVRNGVDGLLVPPGDVGALAAAIRRLLDAPLEREQLAARAIEVRQRFGEDHVMALWQEVLQSAAAAT